MRAVIASTKEESSAPVVTDRPKPEPADGEVLIRVEAAGVNRADLLQAAGNYDPPPGATDVLGLECAGIVAALGPGVDRWAVGDEVVALLAGGGYAEYVAVPAGQVAPRPEGSTAIEAASLMEVAATVWSNVVMTAGLGSGELFLIHGGSSGIGTFAIQLGRALGADVAVTAGSPEKLAACRDLGAQITINYREEDFVAVLDDAGRGADVILDVVGAAYLDRNVRALATGGRLVTIGLQGGVKGELNLGRLLTKRASVTATSLRARPVEEKSIIVAEVVEHVWPLVAQKKVAPIVHRILPLEKAAEAHEILRDSRHIGKVVLTTEG